jgi:hypothetical protein
MIWLTWLVKKQPDQLVKKFKNEITIEILPW